MNDLPEDHQDHQDHEETGAGGVEAVEAALIGALDFRAGGSFDGAGSAPVDESKFAAIEREVDGGRVGHRRQISFLAIAASLAVLLFMSVAVARGSKEDGEVNSGDGGTTSTAPVMNPPGTGPPGTAGPTVTELPPGTVTTTTVPVATSTPIITSAPTRPVDIRTVDLRNFTYPRSVCAAGTDLPQPTFTLVDGEASIDEKPGNYYAMHLQGDVRFGDATGDGVDEAAAAILCAPGGRDGYGLAVVVVSIVDGVPKVIGTRPDSGTATLQTFTRGGVEQQSMPVEYIEDIRFVSGQLVVRWHHAVYGEPDAPERKVTVSYRWDGTSFVPAGESEVEIIPAPPPPVPPTDEEKKAIESFDFRSMAVPLAPAGRDWWKVLCQRSFDGYGPLDATLANGEVYVKNEMGTAFGLVRIESTQYADIDRDGIEEALILTNCSRSDGHLLRSLAVYKMGPDGPELFHATSAVAGSLDFDDVIDVRVQPDNLYSLVITYQLGTQASAPGRMTIRIAYMMATVGLVEGSREEIVAAP